jgi:hypothetical protein
MHPFNIARVYSATLGVFALLTFGALLAQTPGDPLERGFANPPDGAKPRVWWHWMNGNITKEGIQLDLEWMKRVGIGGFQNFDAALNTPQVVEKRLAYMTPEWKEAFKFTAVLADRLGLEMAIAGSPGWSESGGPWVPPSQAMKKFVWSETSVEASICGRTVPEHPSGSQNLSQYVRSPAGLLCRYCRGCLSGPGKRRARLESSAEDHLQRRSF